MVNESEGSENTNFALKNKNVENWEKAEFWEIDPMQNNQSLCDIIIYVDWKEQTANVETQMKTNSMNGAVWNGLASEFELPEDTDFVQFPEFYKDEVQPLLQKIGDGFSKEWDGSNWKGRFSDECEELNEIVDTILRENTPKHDMIYYFSLRDSYDVGGISQLKNDLDAEGIDIITANLDDEGVMSLAVETVTYGDGCDYKLINVDAEAELREIQEELREEGEE